MIRLQVRGKQIAFRRRQLKYGAMVDMAKHHRVIGAIAFINILV